MSTAPSSTANTSSPSLTCHWYGASAQCRRVVTPFMLAISSALHERAAVNSRLRMICNMSFLLHGGMRRALGSAGCRCEQAGESEREFAFAVELQIAQALFRFGDGRNVAGLDPPQRQMHVVEAFEPLLALPQDFCMHGAIH